MSDRQNVAITDEIEIRLKRDFGTYPNSVEGRRQGEWVLMDYVDFIVHVFSAEKRAFYGLERLRKSATVLSIEDLNSEIKAAITLTRKKPTKKAPPTTAVKKIVAPKKAPLPKAAPVSKKSVPVKKVAAAIPSKKAVGIKKVATKILPKKRAVVIPTKILNNSKAAKKPSGKKSSRKKS